MALCAASQATSYRKFSSAPQSLVIMPTTSGPLQDVIEAIRVEASDFVIKTVDLKRLDHAVGLWESLSTEASMRSKATANSLRGALHRERDDTDHAAQGEANFGVTNLM